ncbi:alpha/beta hydrolase, partial [Nocardia jejuensis]|uniref:alpha/beta hydrolase n=1 Tax=Nocardia jejuensis TaxID=328049 RepID=UPI0012FAB83D
MPFFNGLHGLVHYRRWPVQRPSAVVVLLHGLGQQSADYRHFNRFLNRYDIDVWAIDHIGHGLSEGDAARVAPVEHLAAHTVQLLERVRREIPEAPLALIGHSLGAGTALITMGSESAAVRSVSAVALTGTPNKVLELNTPAPPVPTLVLHGQDDRRAHLDPIRTWSATRPTVTMREFPDAGHDLLHEPVRHAVAGALLGFLTSHLLDPAARTT